MTSHCLSEDSMHRWLWDEIKKTFKGVMIETVNMLKHLSTFKGENANVTSAFAPKFTSTAILSPRPLRRRGKISEIISQPIGPKDNCKTNFMTHRCKEKIHRTKSKVYNLLV